MSFIDLPGKAEALKDDWRPLENADNGMGDTVGMISEYLEEGLEQRAQEMTLDYPMERAEYDVLVNPDKEVAVMYGEFYKNSWIPLIGADVWLCEKTNSSDHRGGTAGKREYRAPSRGGETLIEETSLRAHADYLDEQA